jgi:hypothetical protein
MSQPQQRQAPAAAGPPTGKWYYVITLASCGLLAAVPFFHAAAKLHRPQLRKVGAWYAGAALVGYTMIGFAPVDADGNPTGWLANVAGVGMLIVIVGAILQQIGLREEVYGDPQPPVAKPRNVMAIEQVEQERSKRREARALAQRDPMMARELRIGRPDLPRGYDDGGLVDLNAATAEAIAAVCQIPIASAERLVATREALGAFTNVDEAIVYADVSSAGGLRERGIVIAPVDGGE